MAALLLDQPAPDAYHVTFLCLQVEQQLAYAGVDPDNEDHQSGVLDEAIVPTDLNLLYAQDLRELLDKYLPERVKFTMIAGNPLTLLELDLPYPGLSHICLP